MADKIFLSGSEELTVGANNIEFIKVGNTVQLSFLGFDGFLKITVSPTQPSTPGVNDLWVDIS